MRGCLRKLCAERLPERDANSLTTQIAQKHISTVVICLAM